MAGTVKEEAIKLRANLDRVYNAGKQAEHDSFWDAHQDNGTRTDYSYGFYKWRQSAFHPKHNMTPTNMGYMFRDVTGDNWDLRQRLIDCGVTLDTSQCTNFTQAFSTAKITCVPVVDATGCTELTSTFYASPIHTIEKVILKETNTFDARCFQTSYLENIVIEGIIGNSVSFVYASKLTTASVQSIIDHLKYLTGQTAQTLSLHTDVISKLTDEQSATILAKNWTF